MKRLTLLVLMLASITSCKKPVDFGLTFALSPNKSYALNNPVFSCGQIGGIDGKTTDTPAISPYRVLLGKPVITWTNVDKYLAIDQIVVVFQNPNLPGGKYVYQGVDLTEFKGILKGLGNYPSGWDSVGNYIQKATAATATSAAIPTVLSANCEFRIGGIPITETMPSLRVGGRIKIFGRAVGLDSSKNVTSEDPVYAEVPVFFEYVKF